MDAPSEKDKTPTKVLPTEEAASPPQPATDAGQFYSLKELNFEPAKAPKFWWKLLGWCSLLFGTIILIIVISNTLGFSFVAACLTIVVFFEFLALVFFLDDTLKVEIFGFKLVCAYNEADKTISYSLLRRKEKLPECDIALVLPVSGWFTYPRIVSKYDTRGWSYPAQRWSVKTATLQPEQDILLVALRDKGGNRICLPLEQAFSILERFSNVEMGEPKSSWTCVLDSILAAEAQNGITAAEVAKLQAMVLADTELIFETIIRLDATRRFMVSKEAKAIRDWLVAGLLRRLPPDDPRRKLYLPLDGATAAEAAA